MSAVDHNNPRCETEMVRITGRNSWEIQNEETNATHAKICLPLLEGNNLDLYIYIYIYIYILIFCYEHICISNRIFIFRKCT